jgi:two-component system, sensor histidine kinase PdtaS
MFFSWACALTCFLGTGYGQPLSGPETVRRYSIAQQRLLVLSTTRFLDLITVHNLEEDSVRSMACRITGLPWLLPYTEGLDPAAGTPGSDLIDSGRISEAARLLNSAEGEGRIQLLLQLGIAYLHWPTHPPADLDSANRFIREAMQLTSADKDSRLRKECQLLLGDYCHKSGRLRESKDVFLRLVASGQLEGNKAIVAQAWERLGTMKENGDSLNLIFLNNALSLYKELPSREKEMELLWDLANLHSSSQIPLFQKDFERILMLEQATGFKHTLYAQYMLAYAASMKTEYLDESNYCRAALANLQWSGISLLKPTFFTRMGATYISLNKPEEALSWFQKALDLRTKETHFFWYKSLLFLGGQLVNLGRAGEALSRTQAVISEFPPLTPWEKMEINSIIAGSFELLNKPDSADRYDRVILDLSNRYPNLDGQFSRNYFDIASFYVSRGNPIMARVFLDKGVATGERNIPTLIDEARLQYKLDSSKGDYRAALEDHIRYKNLFDSNTNIDQRNKLQELEVKFDAQKKDQDIKYLRQQQAAQQLESGQNKLVRNVLIAIAGLFLIIIGLLFSRYRLKQRTNHRLEAQQQAINDQNLALRHLVKEKEWLVKEIHHRVKNNFQTVVGLLGTQCGYLNSETALNAIRDSQQRIQAMSLIHQRLYRTENLSAVSMPEYIHELVDFLRESFTVSPLIRIRLQIEPIVLDLEHCIPLGLILNEAITNSFKYAFLHAGEGIVFVSFSHTGPKHLELTIKDNGAGLPPGFDGSKTNSMGMNLMHGLCREIGATICVTSHPGTQITIGFDYEAEFSSGMTAATFQV